MNKLTALVWMFAVGLVAAFGLFLLIKGARNVRLALASVKWPATTGIVISAETTRTVTPAERKRAASVTFSTRTVIRYSVSGHDYTTDTLHFGQTLGSSDKSEAALQRLRYPEGATVPVSYDPGNPATGVMKPGLHAEAFWLPGAGLAFLLPAVLLVFMTPSIFPGGFGKSMMGINTEDQAFANAVHEAIEAARRGQTVVRPIPPPSHGDSVMTMAATGFAAVFLCLGILALAGGLHRVLPGYASQSWPSTPGTIVVANKGGGEDGGDAPDDSTDSAYRVRFVYRYDVAGKTHFNNVRQFAQAEGGSREEGDRIASRYHQGAGVRVTYFPVDPDISVLEPGNSSDALWLPGIGIVLILFSLAVFIWVVPAVAKSI